MLDDEEINDHADENGDKDLVNGACNINWFLAEAYILGKFVPKNRRQYES